MADYDTGYQREARPDDDQPIYRCPTCQDRAYLLESKPGNYHTAPQRGLAYMQAIPCRACDAGLAVLAGLWMDQLYPATGSGKRVYHPAGQRRWARFELEEPTTAERVKARVLELVEQRNNEHRRKLDNPPGWGDR